MKKHYYTLIAGALSLVLLLLPVKAAAQITISSGEWPTAFGTAWTQYSAEDTTGNGIPVNVGAAGGPQTWNFSEAMFPEGITQGVSIEDPATTPYFADFPTADHVWRMFFQDGGFTIDVYSYLDLASSDLLSLGFAGTIGPASILEDNVPDDLVLQFPAALGTSWTSNYTVTTSPFPGALQIDSTSRHSFIDAWGTIQLPNGTFDCLRIFDDEISFYSLYVGGVLFSSDTITSYTYAWITEQEGLLAEVISLENEPNPNFNLAEAVTFQTLPSGIGDAPSLLADGFVLRQNYPNPFNPTTNIGFVIADLGFTELKIYDVLGREVKTLVNRQLFPGSYEERWDGTNNHGQQVPGGIYFYRLKTESFEQTRKMLLIR